MFSDSAIAIKFSMAKYKLSYFINFGLYPLPFQYLRKSYIVGQAQLMNIKYVLSSYFDYLFHENRILYTAICFFYETEKIAKISSRMRGPCSSTPSAIFAIEYFEKI